MTILFIDSIVSVMLGREISLVFSSLVYVILHVQCTMYVHGPGIQASCSEPWVDIPVTGVSSLTEIALRG